jgi:hypothetical protein
MHLRFNAGHPCYMQWPRQRQKHQSNTWHGKARHGKLPREDPVGKPKFGCDHRTMKDESTCHKKMLAETIRTLLERNVKPQNAKNGTNSKNVMICF